MLFLMLSLWGCGLSSDAIEGKVIDESTGKPIADAIVVAQWTGYVSVWFVDSQSTCFHVLSTKTNKQGRYYFPDWRKSHWGSKIRNQGVSISAHKAGYRWADKQGDTVRYLHPFKGNRQERLEYLKRVEEGIRCFGRSAGETSKNLIPLCRSLYQEAQRIAVTAEDRAIVNSLRYSLEKLELGWEMARARLKERALDKQ